jgi:hypothetical protein
MAKRHEASLTAANKARVLAYEQWAKATSKATEALIGKLRAIPTEDAQSIHSGLSEQDSFVPEISRWLAARVSLACDVAEWKELGAFTYSLNDLETLRAIRNNTRSLVYANPSAGVALAAEFVEQTLYGIAHRVSGDFPPIAHASALQNILAWEVHPDFQKLREKIPEVLALLLRYEADPHRRRTKRGVAGKLGADGILAEINKMSGHPLGVGALTPNAIANAKKRHKKLRDPRNL